MKKESSLFKTFRFWFISFIVFYFVATVFILPIVVKSQVTDFLNNNLKQHATLERVRFNPLGFEFRLYNFQLFDKNNELLVDFENIRVDFALLRTLFTQVVHFDAISLYKPTINIKLLKDGKINLLELVPTQNETSAKQKEEESPKKKLFPISFSQINLEETEILFTDYTADKPFKVSIFPLNYNFVNLSTQLEEKGTYDFNIVLNKHTKIAGQGSIALNPLKINGDISLNELHLLDFWPRVEKEFKFYIKDALVDFKSKYAVSIIDDELEVNLNKTDIKLSQFALGSKKDGRDLITLDTFKTTNLSLSYPKQSIDIKSIKLDSFYTDLIIQKNIRTNIADLFEKKVENDKEKEMQVEKEDTKAWQISVSGLNVNEAKVDITDLSKEKSFKLVLNKIDYEFKNLSTKDNSIENQKLFIQVNNHTNINLNGNVNIDPLKLSGLLKIDNIQTNDFWSHVNDETNFNLHNTRIDVSTKYFVDIQKELEVILSNATLNINNLNIASKKSKNTIIGSKNINTKVTSFNLAKQDIQIENIQLDKLYTDFILKADKSNNIESLFISPKKEEKKSKKVKNEKVIKEKEWSLSVKNIDVKDSKVKFNDKSIKKTFSTSLNTINLNVKNIDLKPKTKFSYTLKSKIGNKSTLQTSGKISIKPVDVQSKYSLQKLPLEMFQPYLDETLNLDLKKADFYTKGKFNLKSNQITLSSDTNIKNIDVKYKNSKESLLKVKQVNINNLNFEQGKNTLKIASVDLIQPYAKVHIDKDKSTNFDNIIKPSTKNSNKEAKGSIKKENDKALAFDLGPIDIKEGSMDFTDLSLPLPFQSFIEKLQGEVSGLSSYSTKPSDISMGGVIDKYGLAKIDGSLDYKNINQNTKINMLFKNIATKNLSPYSSEFIGRKINGGKLTLDLHYRIVESKLDATNKIVVERIKLGEELKSENSVSVPIDLAIALLEDSKGVIDLSLPISGDVNDPNFQIGSIVGQAFTNLIVKIVTSPFTFLGSLLGVEGEELKYVDFESGQTIILPPAQEKLDMLVEAFKTRPNLALEINKSYHKQKDTYSLKTQKFDNKLTVVIDVLNKKNKGKDTYLMALESLYNNNKPAVKLEDVKKDFWIEKDKKKIFQTTNYINHLKETQVNLETVSTQELEAMADSRANTIVNYLVTKHQAPKDRILLKELVVLEDEDTSNWVKIELGVAVKQN